MPGFTCSWDFLSVLFFVFSHTIDYESPCQISSEQNPQLYLKGGKNGRVVWRGRVRNGLSVPGFTCSRVFFSVLFFGLSHTIDYESPCQILSEEKPQQYLKGEKNGRVVWLGRVRNGRSVPGGTCSRDFFSVPFFGLCHTIDYESPCQISSGDIS